MQEQELWCWAAVADFVAEWMSYKKEQCNIASWCLPQVCAAACTSDTPCNVHHTLVNGVLQAGHTATELSGAISPAVLTLELKKKRPVGVRIAWKDKNPHGHFVAVIGLGDAPNTFDVYDPARIAAKYNFGSISTMTYGRLQSDYNDGGIWTHTYIIT